MELFSEGGLRDEGGTVEPESGNEVPSGSLQKEVADDIPIMISEGEFVFPADVVRYIGLNTLMKMRQDAKQGLKMMEKMGQMGNPEEAELPDDIPFGMADLIVVGSDDDDKDEKAEGGMIEMQTGGLLDDPRFSDPAKPSTPTLTDEDKKEMEDALLGTAYGDITMKRYVNAEGDVKYIPFIGDVPQMPIPEGYELDNSAPKTPSLVGQGSDSGDSDGGGGGQAQADMFNMMQMQREPQPKRKPIEEWTEEELLAHYESFSNPVNRFLVPIVGALFGGLPALFIAGAQQYNLTNGPTSLKRTEELLSQKFSNLNKEQRERLIAARKIVKEKGVTGFGLIKTIVQKVTGKKDSPEENALDKAIASGKSQNVSRVLGAIAEVKLPLSKPDLIDGANEVTMEDIFGKDSDYYTPKEIKESPFPNAKVADLYGMPPADDVTMEDIFGKDSDYYTPEAVTPETVEKEKAQTVQTVDIADPRKLEVPTLTGEKIDSLKDDDPIATRMGTAPTDDLNIDIPDTVGRARRVSRSPFTTDEILDLRRSGRGFRTQQQTKPDPKKEAEKARRQKIEDLKKTSMGTDYGKQRVSDDEDRDDGGSSSSPSFTTPTSYISEPYQPNVKSTYTTTYKPPAPTGRSPGAMGGRPDGYQAPSNIPDFAAFYVGGVPTKPMKPQRLKKGGLAKPKVKPKRMKKGGLASKKK